MSEKDDREAIGLYAVLAYDACDFIDMCGETNNEVLKTLYLMLATPYEKHTKGDVELNEIGVSIVRRILGKRSVPLPAIPKE